MTTDLEADLRREFDAATPPTGSLTFSADSVLQQGSRTIRRRRLIAAGSTAFAVALIATGASLLSQPDDKALPLPATHTATTGIVRAQSSLGWGHSDVEFNRDPRFASNVVFSAVADGKRRVELGQASAGRPGQAPVASWKSGMVNGHPVTIGVVPGSNPPTITLAGGATYGVGGEPLDGTGYSMFYVHYTRDDPRDEPARPAEITRIWWTSPNGIIDGFEGDHKLTGRAFRLNSNLSAEVILGSDSAGRTTLFGSTHLQYGSSGYGMDLSTVTTDPQGVAIVTGRQPVVETIVEKGQKVKMGTAGPPMAAGILPAGSSVVGWVLSAGAGASPVVLSERRPDGTVIFAMKVPSGQESVLLKATVKTVTWTNADGSKGRKDVIQK